MFNSKTVISLTLLIILVFSAGALAQQFKDVPRDHWAYDSVQKLAEKGYLSLYSGEDFNGEQALTRYEMAEIIASVLENIGGSGSAQDLSQEDVNTIRDLSLEFRDELVSVAERQKKFEERLNTLEDTNQIQDEDISNLNVRVSETQDKVNTLDESVKEIDKKISSLEEELNALKEEGASGQKLQELEDNQSVALTRIEELEKRIEELEAEKQAAQQAEKEGGSINPGYVLGGLAVLALLL